jgi:hypothetical protein
MQTYNMQTYLFKNQTLIIIHFIEFSIMSTTLSSICFFSFFPTSLEPEKR